jgi:predicted metal-dependent HD superfamily phosphohydrolase
MSTPAVTVYINGDSAQLGEELGKAIQAIRDAGGSVEQAATKFSMLEARGSVQLLASEFGVHVPREISRMVASIDGLGPVLQNMVGIMAAVWAITAIEKYITKMREAEAAVSEGFSKALEATTTRSDELRAVVSG